MKTLYYGFVIRIKLMWYTRKKRKGKKVTKKFLSEKLINEKINPNIVEKISDNYLNIGEIFLDRKNLKAAFSVNQIFDKKRTNGNNSN